MQLVENSYTIKAVHLSFTIVLKGGGRIPFYPGTLFRSMLGKHLHDMVCLRPNLKCEDCPFNARCPYGATFEPVSSKVAPQYVNQMRYLTPPFVIEAPTFQNLRILSGQRIEIGLKLFGYAVDHFKYFVEAIRLTGISGLGPDRVPFTVEEIRYISNNGGGSKVISSHTDISRMEPIFQTKNFHDYSSNKVLVVFSTPLRAQVSGKMVRVLTKEVLVSNCLRRAKYLLSMYSTPKELPSVEELIQGIELEKISGNWVDFVRYSARQQNTVPLSGLTGTYSLTGDLYELLPILELCSFAHIGKQTVLGLGEFYLYSPIR
jgi:hypothetical protein